MVYDIVNQTVFALNATQPILQQPVWKIYSTWLNVWFAVMMALCFIGSCLNVLLFIVLISSKKLYSGSGSLIANSIFIECIHCVINLPLLTISSYIPQFGYNLTTYCRYVMMIYYTSFQAGNWLSMLIAVNRFVAIVFPHVYPTWTTRKVLVGMVLLAWISGITCNLPLFFEVVGKFDMAPPWNGCSAIPSAGVIYPLTTALSTFFPIAFLGVIYSLLFIIVGFRSVTENNKVVDKLDKRKKKQKALLKRRCNLAKMLFMAFLWYAICYLPAPIAASLYRAWFVSNPLIQLVFRGFLLVGYATSPVIYLAMNAEYRQRMSGIFRHVINARRTGITTDNSGMMVFTMQRSSHHSTMAIAHD